MKTHLLLFCAAALLLTGCAATRQTSEQKAAEQAAIAQAVREQVPAASFKIIATEMIPLRAPSKTLTDKYFVKVSDNCLESALPYFGRATNIPYGGGNALDFKTDITSYDWAYMTSRSWRRIARTPMSTTSACTTTAPRPSTSIAAIASPSPSWDSWKNKR